MNRGGGYCSETTNSLLCLVKIAIWTFVKRRGCTDTVAVKLSTMIENFSNLHYLRFSIFACSASSVALKTGQNIRWWFSPVPDRRGEGAKW
jgi:hypothetical protein